MLSVSGLSIRLREKELYIAKDISFHIPKGKSLGLIGESGCGKTMSILSLLRLLPNYAMFQESGKIVLDNQIISDLPLSDFRSVRGKEISIIFQEAMTSLNPVLTIEKQIGEILRLHRHMSRKEAKKEGLYWLSKVGIQDAKYVLQKYPHQLSGGMKQRIMIAMALCCYPKVIIADEPTTALDVTVQKQILKLLKTMQQEQETSLLVVTHDLGVVAFMCDFIAVMYAGRIVETANASTLFTQAKHPYTIGLLQSVQSLLQADENLSYIEGQVPPLDKRSKGCPFEDRCAYTTEICKTTMPPMQTLNEKEDHKVACYYVDNNTTSKCVTYE